ncbi:histidinol-phosphatase [Sciscionella marina]|uniref:histidinol-phosphatase n=1 Tax=Sciscionella marina TaxID=508770 RepID=UPI00035FAB08|nr:histidinol-phosphatase [Sciscionella marina]
MSTADLTLALELAEAADEHTLARFAAVDLRVETKPDRTPVTDADIAVEDLIRARIAERRPGDGVAGEERGGTVGTGRCWLVDPIDGTKNFSRGVGVWATLIALLEDGEPVVGVASAPALGRRWWAAKGQGAFVRDHRGTRRITVSGVGALADAYLSTTEFTTWREHHSLAAYQRLSGACWQSRALGDFWSHCLVAEGAIDLAAEPIVNPWDLAALFVIVTEAGGRFTDLSGQPRYDNGSALSSNGLLHEAALGELDRQD